MFPFIILQYSIHSEMKRLYTKCDVNFLHLFTLLLPSAFFLSFFLLILLFNLTKVLWKKCYQIAQSSPFTLFLLVSLRLSLFSFRFVHNNFLLFRSALFYYYYYLRVLKSLFFIRRHCLFLVVPFAYYNSVFEQFSSSSIFESKHHSLILFIFSIFFSWSIIFCFYFSM